ncbi:hypothetical protein HTG_04560 [Natrinema mahii]|nr:hypothetical protein HTG_04560 [Natrinema mahii]
MEERELEWEPPSVDNKATLWRYMGFPQYVSLLSRQALRFTYARELSDPYEGLLPEENKQEWKEHLMEKQEKRESHASRIVEAINKHIGNYLVNCWTCRDHQSAALWDLYINNAEGVAIKTSAKSLSTALESNEYSFYSGLVGYRNYNEDTIPNADPSMVFHKRQSFNHEKEYRVVVQNQEQMEKSSSGEYIDCKLGELVHEVYVHPSAAGWFCDLVERVTSDYGLDVAVKQSSLFDDPIQ